MLWPLQANMMMKNIIRRISNFQHPLGIMPGCNKCNSAIKSGEPLLQNALKTPSIAAAVQIGAVCEKVWRASKLLGTLRRNK